MHTVSVRGLPLTRGGLSSSSFNAVHANSRIYACQHHMLQAYDSDSVKKYDSAEMRDNDNSIVVAAGAVTALLQALAVILKHPKARLQAKGHATATIVSILLKVC
jgi:hypothetical protein